MENPSKSVVDRCLSNLGADIFGVVVVVEDE